MARIWNKFGTESYVKNNYAQFHDEDKKILELCLGFLADKPKIHRAMEVGTGPNLYPAILLTPYAESIDLIEYSKSNLDYLLANLESAQGDWKPYLNFMSKHNKKYSSTVFKDLASKSNVKQGSIYTLPEKRYNLVSMFFCAESITGYYPTFARACHSFMRSAKKGGIVIAAFMQGSKGYKIDGINFPAVSIGVDELNKLFLPQLKNAQILEINKSKQALRAGYSGMLLVVGEKK